MIRSILKQIDKLEKDKQSKIEAQAKLQTQIDELDVNLKKANFFKKNYEKIQKDFTEFLNNNKKK